jgi:prevent-host-death family protein
MADAIEDVESMAAFKRDTATVAARLKKSGKPLVLTVNGKEELVVQDAAAYRRLQELAALAAAAEMKAFLTRSRADIEAGITLPAVEFVKSLGTKS